MRQKKCAYQRANECAYQRPHPRAFVYSEIGDEQQHTRPLRMVHNQQGDKISQKERSGVLCTTSRLMTYQKQPLSIKAAFCAITGYFVLQLGGSYGIVEST